MASKMDSRSTSQIVKIHQSSSAPRDEPVELLTQMDSPKFTRNAFRICPIKVAVVAILHRYEMTVDPYGLAERRRAAEETRSPITNVHTVDVQLADPH